MQGIPFVVTDTVSGFTTITISGDSLVRRQFEQEVSGAWVASFCCLLTRAKPSVIPVETGIHLVPLESEGWIPSFEGMTAERDL
jgi:hypothetical protein